MESSQRKHAGAVNNVLDLPNAAEIVNTVVAVCLGKKDKSIAIKELTGRYKEAAFLHFENEARQQIKRMFDQSDSEAVRNLSEKDYPDRLVESTKGVAELIHHLYRNEISVQELMDGLSETGIKDIANDTVCALGLQEKLNIRYLDTIIQLSADMTAYSSLAAVYQELMKALEDERIAHEHRLQIEEECTKTIEEITKYRKDMEAITRHYLKDGYETIEAGFSAIDRAILEDDSDGYIKGNAEFQKWLGYDVQFTNQEEFDELMLSDDAFKF